MAEKFSRGMKVLIPKGTKVYSFNPSRRNYISGRAQWVKVFNVYNFVPCYHKGPEVSWAGSGGYWCHAAIEDIIQANYDAGVLERPNISETM